MTLDSELNKQEREKSAKVTGPRVLVRHLRNERLFLFGAPVWGRHVALALERVLDKLLERVEVAAAAVLVPLGVRLRGEVFDGWVSVRLGQGGTTSRYEHPQNKKKRHSYRWSGHACVVRSLE
jgi:hypothetical protein